MSTRVMPALELGERDQLRHFNVNTVDGRRVRYAELWQRRPLVLVLVRPDQHGAAGDYARTLAARAAAFDDAEAAVVVTADLVEGLLAPAVVVADRWGEIVHLERPPGDDLQQLPPADDLLDWIRFTRIQCPECPP